ncbi:hypothetical protein CHH28_07365 [Bacterioplanes sanyensis]|uniref:Uncharacterized protein n=2 Tax=Bacterioplanes sanyensis TaxID=1249553 RepID=A0A222FJA2_9GAMM|nr:hypothetical protein CHH28_07365 [Bacterioplanes sanyensis]
MMATGYRLAMGLACGLQLSALMPATCMAQWLPTLEYQLALTDQQSQAVDVQSQRWRLQPQWVGQYQAWRFNVLPQLELQSSGHLQGEENQNRDNYPPEDINYNGPLYWHSGLRADMREAYADYDGTLFATDWSLRLGKQQVAWGQADGFRVLDIINPQDLREFNLPDQQDTRIATWMLNSQWSLGGDQILQLIVIPDLTFSERAPSKSPFAITSPELTPTITAGQAVVRKATKRPDWRPEWALRWSDFVFGWDVSASYFAFFHDTPVIYREVIDSVVHVSPEYRSSQLLGVAANTVYGSWVHRFELAWLDRQFLISSAEYSAGINESPEAQFVYGLDFQGWSNSVLSYQLYLAYLQDEQLGTVRHQQSIRHTMMMKRSFLNDTLNTEVFLLLNRDYNDGQWRLTGDYQWNDNWVIELALDAFYGPAIGPFGQYQQANRLSMGLEYSF